MAAAASVGVDRWQGNLSELMLRVGGRFFRPEPRRHARSFVAGLLAGLPRTNCPAVAEHAGHVGPDAMQHLLAAAVWDEDGVRDDLRDYVVQHLSDQADSSVGPVVVADETGDVKKGRHTVGVARQYTGTAGRIENAQVGVYLVYATSRGYAFIDRELYLPAAWADDLDRRQRAGVPAEVTFATKPALARQMVTRALDAGVQARWFAGDEVYGNDPHLRRDLRVRGLGYVLTIARSHQVGTTLGIRRAVDLAVRPDLTWHRVSAGPGAHGHRCYDWALIGLHLTDSDYDRHGGHHALLVRRHRRTGEMAFYRTWTPTPVPLSVLVIVAGRRWTIEEAFQVGKGLAALDEHQVRRWTSWRRWTVLAMLAHAFLAVTAATSTGSTTSTSLNATLIRLTCGETRRLLQALTTPPTPTLSYTLHWSHWRRRTQARARTSHYQRQTLTE